jgi:hypothetical protein
MYEEESNALGLVILLCGGLFIGCCAAVACFLGLEEILRSLT